MITLNRDAIKQLARALPKLKKVQPRSRDRSILHYVLIRPMEAEVQITATDIMHAVHVRLPADIRGFASGHFGAVMPFASLDRLLRGWNTTVNTNPPTNAGLPLRGEEVLDFKGIRREVIERPCTRCKGSGTFSPSNRSACLACKGSTIEKKTLAFLHLGGTELQLSGRNKPRACQHRRLKMPGLAQDTEVGAMHLDISEFPHNGDTPSYGAHLIFQTATLTARIPAQGKGAGEFPMVYDFDGPALLWNSQDIAKKGELYPSSMSLALSLFRTQTWRVINAKNDGNNPIRRIYEDGNDALAFDVLSLDTARKEASR